MVSFPVPPLRELLPVLPLRVLLRALPVALMLLELNAELLELADEASNVTTEVSVVELERAC